MRPIVSGIAVAAFSLLLALPALPAEDAGKKVFDNTCKVCHGPDGQGSQTAQDFYKVKIPSLVSDYVQSKTNSELKEIISGGKGRMIPVTTPSQMGRRPAAPHSKKLSAEDTEAVIGFVRSLAK